MECYNIILAYKLVLWKI